MSADGTWHKARPLRPPRLPRPKKPRGKTTHGKPYRVGVDGEGVEIGGQHRYVLLTWAEDGERGSYVENASGLTTVQCLDFLLGIPNLAKAFGFAFNYDLTMMLRDLPPDVLYRLFRPELRRRIGSRANRGPMPVQWLGYRLNLMGTRFTVERNRRKRVVWDVFRFYQSAFVKALRNWKTAPAYVIDRIQSMKKRRNEFHANMLPEIREYCREECQLLARLVTQLITAHDACGLDLRAFYGAGSTAGLLLDSWAIGEKKRDASAKKAAMRSAIASAFFGGRFENSVAGIVEGPIYSYDICSAYPYELAFLPCLDHGVWSHTRSEMRMREARAALVEYVLPRGERRAWGPFPFRDQKGCIIYPGESGGGWVWRQEFLAGERLFQNVRFCSAWVFEHACDHRPFAAIPRIYLERLRLGKDGAGIVLKLGMNSVYGKLAQSVGRPKFQSWIWAGMVTAGTRSIALDVLGVHRDWENCLSFATDGILTREPLALLPVPRDTGTSEGAREFGKEPLGGWDRKVEHRPVFFSRPGVFFPLDPTEEDVDRIRARGIGRKELFEASDRLVSAWRAGRYGEIELGTLRRFCGAKSSTRPPSLKNPEYRKTDEYGCWVERPVTASMNPLPKRAPLIDRRGDMALLHVRRFPGQVSAPYNRAALSPESLELRRAQSCAEEQPEGVADEWEDDGE